MDHRVTQSATQSFTEYFVGLYVSSVRLCVTALKHTVIPEQPWVWVYGWMVV
jgi:hypothetical protein